MKEIGRLGQYGEDRKFKTEFWRRKDKTVQELGKIRLDGGDRKDKTEWRS